MTLYKLLGEQEVLFLSFLDTFIFLFLPSFSHHTSIEKQGISRMQQNRIRFVEGLAGRGEGAGIVIIANTG